MNIQRLRNLTTGRLHTDIGHVYQDIEYFTGETGVMTHMLPNANRALKPYLEQKVSNPRFYDGEYDPSHIGEIDIEPMDETEKGKFWERYAALPSPLAGKNIIAVKVPDPQEGGE